MKDGTEMKGLVVEQHEDRVLLNTEQGEVPVMRENIRDIVYDDPEQTFLHIGESHEAAQNWGEALAFYQKALQVNPDFEEAQKAVTRVRNRFWSKAAEGPNREIEKRQSLYDSWGKVKSGKEKFEDESRRATRSLEQGIGLMLGQKGDWVAITQVTPRKEAALAGLKKGDRFVSMEGRSLRYLTAEVVTQKCLFPRYSNFTLEYERDCKLSKTGLEKFLVEFGFEAKLEPQGVVIQRVLPDSDADQAGLKQGDLLVSANGTSLRYLPLKKLLDVILAGPADNSVMSVRRFVILPRK